MTAYQRRKRDIAYLRQCESELRALVEAIIAHNGGSEKVKVPLTAGVDGDRYITPYNCGEYAMSLISIGPK